MEKIVGVFIFILLIGTILSVTGSMKVNDSYDYYTYEEMTNLLFELSETNSNIMSLTSIGKTYQGRDIWVVKLSDNVNIDEDEPGVFLDGAHHGNEKPSYEVLIYFIKYMVENYNKENIDNDIDGRMNEDQIDGFDNDNDGLIDEDTSEDRIKDAINNTQIYLIPMVNPDGVEADERKNRAPNYGWFGLRKKITSYGVDLNRNYGYLWFLKYIILENITHFKDKSEKYGGEKPFSENETNAIKNFIENINLSIYLSYHTYNRSGLTVWFWWRLKPKNDDNIMFSIAENISQINKYEIKSWRGILPPRIGTSTCWMYGKYNVYSFLIELKGNETAPTDPVIVNNMCKDHVGVNLYLCERALLLKSNIY
jgi:carboxypeptidase T